MDGYGSRFLQEAFGVPVSSLHYWDRTDLLKPSVRPAAGRGSRRLYSFRDVVQALVILRLRELGISLQRIRRCLHYLRQNFPQVEAPAAEVSLFTDGDTVFILTSDPAVLQDTLREQLLWSVPLAHLVRDVRETLARATSPQREELTLEGQRFTAVLEQDPQDGWWVGLVEGLPGLGSQGPSREECLRMVADVVREYLEDEGAASTHARRRPPASAL